jgi:16S rRNA (guanine527-N7)-methyltransferase
MTLMPPSVPAPPSSDTIHRAMKEFSLTANSLQVQQVQEYTRLLLRWNEAINLTAIRDPLEILYRHICESMFAASVVPLGSGRLADVGSGGGFPGLPLKIFCPRLEVFLIESNVKKATFLAEVVRALELTGTRVLVSRYEELGEEVAPLDFVCSRALGEFPEFVKWASTREVDAQHLLLWVGGRDVEDVKGLPGWHWQEPIQISQSLRRFLLVGTKQAASTPVGQN